MDSKTAANQSLETMLRESLWASALIPDELDRWCANRMSDASRPAAMRCATARTPTAGSA